MIVDYLSAETGTARRPLFSGRTAIGRREVVTAKPLYNRKFFGTEALAAVFYPRRANHGARERCSVAMGGTN